MISDIKKDIHKLVYDRCLKDAMLTDAITRDLESEKKMELLDDIVKITNLIDAKLDELAQVAESIGYCKCLGHLGGQEQEE
tara:strand:+ start:729 stop:971 length:243 start_codon:yes stop_codon:yes gene_type:complete